MTKLPDIDKIYLSVIPTRNPKEKIHIGLGRAKAAISGRKTYRAWSPEKGTLYYFRNGGKIYKLNGNEWELLYDIKPGANYEDLPWIAEREQNER